MGSESLFVSGVADNGVADNGVADNGGAGGANVVAADLATGPSVPVPGETEHQVSHPWSSTPSRIDTPRPHNPFRPSFSREPSGPPRSFDTHRHSPVDLPYVSPDPPYDPSLCIFTPYYTSPTHRRYDTLWMTQDRNNLCQFHQDACGTYACCCDCCGLLFICYLCKQHFVRNSRTACPKCNRRPLQKELFLPLY